MAKQTIHIRRHLRASTPVAALLDEIEQREQLLRMVRNHLPRELGAHCRQVALADGELTLFVESPIWVDRLRYRCADLVSGLLADGLEVERCRVRVLPDSRPSVPVQQGASRDLYGDDDPAGADQPSSPLARALLRLARTLGRASET
ncbi:MAG: DUF721 domain-containing protein [Gammaproteobacteria bacterium]|jgi:hypothetical protein|nr:DUF721 domain-containing protein [Gammaproteobacteria bacterium]